MRTIRIVSRKYDGSLRDDYEAFLFNHPEQVALYQQIKAAAAADIAMHGKTAEQRQ